MVFLLGLIGVATFIKTLVNDVPEKAVEIKRTNDLLKQRKNIPKRLRNAHYLNAPLLLTEDELQSMERCRNKCLEKKIYPAQRRAKMMEQMVIAGGFGRKCGSCGNVHPA